MKVKRRETRFAVSRFRGMPHPIHPVAALLGVLGLCLLAVLPATAKAEDDTGSLASQGAMNESSEIQRWESHGVTEEYSDRMSRIVLSDVLGEDGFRYRFLPDPPRLYVDILEPKREITWNKLGLKGDVFRRVRVGRYPDKVRLTFDARKGEFPEPQIRAEGTDLVILASLSGPLALPMGGPETAVTTTSTPLVSSTVVAKADWKPIRVKKIDFHQTESSSDVLVETDAKGPYDVRGQGDQILLVMPGTEIPTHLLRHLDTKGFPSSILSIVPEQAGQGPAGQAKITIRLRRKEPFDVVREGNVLRVRVQLPDQPPEIPPLPELQVSQQEEPLVKRVQVSDVPQAVAPQKPPAEVKPPEKRPSPGASLSPSPAQPALGETKPAPKPLTEYTGRKISLDFKDADIQNVLRLIAEVSGKNIVISDAVEGKVTIRLLSVPWDQALDVILKTYALDKEALAPNILRVAPYSQLKTERDAELKAAEAQEKVEPLISKVLPLNYSKANDLQPLLNRLKSKRTDAGILVDSRTNSVVVKDLAANVEEMISLIRELDSPTPQVLIEAKIIELDVGFEDDLGIQWGTLYRAGPATGNPTGMNFPHTASVGGTWDNVSGRTAAGIDNPVVNLPAAVSETAGGALGFSLASITNSFELDAQISALEQKKHVRVLSSPRVATLNNQEARIEQGTEVPFQTTSDEGTKTEFKDAMLRLYVTPQINFDASIIMKIVVSNDTPIADPVVDFIIQKKEAETTVMVNDGDTAVIGGIYTDEDQKTMGGVPFLMDIPGFGSLFKKRAKVENRSELIIFITPRIVPARRVPVEQWMK